MRKPPPAFAWALLGLAAYAAAAVLGVGTAEQSAERRALFERLGDSARVEDAELREYRLLLLERATLAGYQNVEPIARSELDMRYPDQIARVRP